MIERRRADRMLVDMEVQKHLDGESYCCRACEISPTGIRLRRVFEDARERKLIDIEVPLVQGGLHTSLPARKIWSSGQYEAFEFVGPTFAQQAMLERLFGNI